MALARPLWAGTYIASSSSIQSLTIVAISVWSVAKADFASHSEQLPHSLPHHDAVRPSCHDLELVSPEPLLVLHCVLSHSSFRISFLGLLDLQ